MTGSWNCKKSDVLIRKVSGSPFLKKHVPSKGGTNHENHDRFRNCPGRGRNNLYRRMWRRRRHLSHSGHTLRGTVSKTLYYKMYDLSQAVSDTGYQNMPDTVCHTVFDMSEHKTDHHQLLKRIRQLSHDLSCGEHRELWKSLSITVPNQVQHLSVSLPDDDRCFHVIVSSGICLHSTEIP